MSRPALLVWPALLIALVCAAAEPPLANRLGGHPSPYLAMHGDDPVHWQEWGEEVFARAAREGKLVFVSSGYFSCHWCHVMQRESYRDPALAAYINRHFIPVKIDRELLPAVDAGLIDFARQTRGQAGWPLNVFLTPAGHPLIGILYLPPQSFQDFLASLVGRWQAQPEALAAMARAAAEAAPVPRSPPPADAPGPLDAALRRQALAAADELAGGFGEETKFPMAPQLLALLEAQPGADERLVKFLRLTLDQMAAQGLRDHLGGGFFRYTVDPGWQTPHYEKMLYDNALLARVYLRAAALLDEPRYRAIAHETLLFALDTLQSPEGGYYAALSAVDADGAEGGHYLWDRAELARLAAGDWPLLRLHWGLDKTPDTGAGELPVPRRSAAEVAGILGQSPAAVERRIASARLRLLEARARRSLPVDRKRLAGWNGLLLTALAEAAAQTEPGPSQRRFRAAAERLQAFMVTHFLDDGVLVRARDGDRPLGEAGLEDYAYVIEGLQRWSDLFGGTKTDAHRVEALLDQAWRRFYREGGWRLGTDALLRWGQAEASIADGPMPAPPAVLLQNTGVPPSRPVERSAALAAARPLVARQPFRFASYVRLYP